MYDMFSYIYHKIQPNVGKYTSPMHSMGPGFRVKPLPKAAVFLRVLSRALFVLMAQKS